MLDVRIARNVGVTQIVQAATSDIAAEYEYIGLSAAQLIAHPSIVNSAGQLKRQDFTHGSFDEYWRGVSTHWHLDGFGGKTTTPVASFENQFSQPGTTVFRRATAEQVAEHDGLNRIKRFESLAGDALEATTWRNDAAGNAVKYDEFRPWDGNPAAKSTLRQERQFNRKNQLTGTTSHRGPKWVVPKYDRVGNAIEIPQPNDASKPFYCKYDAWNRLVEVQDEHRKLVATYKYDAFGRRVSKQLYNNGSPAEKRYLFYSHDWRLLEEWKQASASAPTTLLMQYAWGLRGPDELVSPRRFQGGAVETLTPIQDEVFNTTSVLGPDGAIKFRAFYDAFGGPVLYTDAGPADPSWDWNILFGGYYFDNETGLYHVRRRMLHPTLGTWLQPDPQGYADGPNLYLYGRGSPVTFVDPTGEFVWFAAAIAFLAVASSPALIDPGQDRTVTASQRSALIHAYHDQRVSEFATWLAMIPAGGAYSLTRETLGWGLPAAGAFSGAAFTASSDAIIGAGTGDLGHYRDASGAFSLGSMAGAYAFNAGVGAAFGFAALGGQAWLRAGSQTGFRRNLLTKIFRPGWKGTWTDLYHGTDTAGARSIRTEGVLLERSKNFLDFGRGFYTTRFYSQAAQRAETYADPAVLTFSVRVYRLRAMSRLRFGGATPPWEATVSYGRAGILRHEFDLIEGPLLRNVNEFMAGSAARHSGHQLSFHTQRAIQVLEEGLL